jgi:hypothetical protein
LFHYVLDPGTPVRSCVPDRLAPAKDASFARSARWTAAPPGRYPVLGVLAVTGQLVMLLIQCAWMIRHDHQGPASSTAARPNGSRVARCQGAKSWAHETRAKQETRWSSVLP